MDKWRTKQDLKNADLWLPLYDCIKRNNITIEVKWVKGHANHDMNNLCDKLAIEARI